MGHYIELTKDNFAEHTQSGVALVDFWAPWCGPCRMLSPVIDKLAEEFEGKAKICKVNTDEQEELSAQFGIRSIPTMLFFKNGEVVDQMVGATSEQVLKDKLNALL
ncbi:thioredoxin [uncultured Helicobacter sp.]|uniref:thioredoxin n=1 Tax=uncultured Helicobacter sp. TaxID=175537 RepID=UPI001F93DE72|nr:thioredoxin [uncultured Helicobacter sp.]HIY44647.1 thioredoxin [Candidatus Helicobacter avistercoris]